MTYTAITVLAVLGALIVDRRVARTRLTTASSWWAAYGIIAVFQLLTNGWLTGRGIVRYAPDAILGGGSATFLGDGRIAYAPVEDLAFGFALVLTTCLVWVRLGHDEGQRS